VDEPLRIPLLKMDPQGFERQLARLRRVREERDNGAVGQALDRLRIAAQGSENVMPHILNAVRVYATLQEIMDVFRAVFGVYREPVIV
jgi:methylmalonyl-CoA mutase (EC 5.4.99.2)